MIFALTQVYDLLHTLLWINTGLWPSPFHIKGNSPMLNSVLQPLSIPDLRNFSAPVIGESLRSGDISAVDRHAYPLNGPDAVYGPLRPKILVVDDDEWIRDILHRILVRANYQVVTSRSAEDALVVLQTQAIDLIISDVNMQGMTGLEFTTVVRTCYSQIPIVLITASCDTNLMRLALREGADDYITKPFDVETVPFIIERTIERCRLVEAGYRHRLMFSNVQVLALAIDAKEPFTAEHSRRVARITHHLAVTLGLSETELECADLAAQVHDVGKIATPDSILNKPSKLEEDEWRVIQLHPIKGAEIVSQVEHLGSVAQIVRAHHERIDGRGYPDGLAGDAIPFLARVISVADAYEVMTSNRVYRPRVSHEVAVQRLLEAAGKQFDCDVVSAFVQLPGEMLL